MYKKLLVLLLCGIMLIGMLASCVDQQEGADDTTGAVEEETNWVSPELEPNEGLRGKEINILANSEPIWVPKSLISPTPWRMPFTEETTRSKPITV